MQIVFKTDPRFLQKHFSYLESSLLGEYQNLEDPTHPSYELSYSFSAQPVIELGGSPSSLEEESEKEELEKIDENLDRVRYQIKQEKEQKVSNKSTEEYAPGLEPLSVPKTAFLTAAANWVLGFLMLGAAIILIVYFGPQFYHSVFSPTSKNSEPQQTTTALGAELQDEEMPLGSQDQLGDKDFAKPLQRSRYLPEINESLPEGDRIIIPRIGVNTPLQKTETAQEALNTGVWWAPDFALPGDLSKPMIVAGHRYGWEWWWKTDYWKYHSFYKLTELEPGDQVEIISGKRKWIYEVYAGEEGEAITDYDADLILYTCKFLNSPIRFFRYAELVIPED